MDLRSLWPAQQDIHDILRGDADGQRNAVLMAVHQPMRIRRRLYHQGAGQGDEVNEAAVLEWVQAAAPDGCHLVLIEGAPGTGKSHLVRWLHQRLEALPTRDKRVTLLVQKGTSLRQIINDLLAREELNGEESGELRLRLRTAQEPITPEHAAERLCGELGTECMRRAEELEGLNARRGISKEEEIDAGWFRLLHHLMVNSELRGHLIGTDGPVLRLVRHLGVATAGREAIEKAGFVADDLRWPAADSGNVGRHARQALGRLADPSERSRAARLLNLALDDAKRVVLGLDASVVGDVFRAIRRSLHKQRKELLLLVEDFADLSGLQRQLLQVAIQQSSDGSDGPLLCTLRTVLAYTTDYIKSADAAFQRAKVVHAIPDDDQTAEGVLERSIRLVASYLHAARLGKQRIEDAYLHRGDHDDWIPTLRCNDDDTVVAEAFGEAGGRYLFPFTREVVQKLMVEELRTLGQFNPRLVIRSIMPRVLDHRQAFIDGEFPSKAFVGPRLAQVLSDQDRDWLRQWTNQDVRARWDRARLYWSDVTRTELAKAYELPQGTAAQQSPPKKPTDVQVIPSDVTLTPIQDSAPPTGWVDQRERCKQWAEGSGAPFDSLKRRRELRDAVGHALRHACQSSWQPRLDWKEDEFKGGGRFAKWTERIRIARVTADDLSPEAAVLDVVTESELLDADRQSAVAAELAAVGFMFERKDWDFEGAEEVAVSFLAFVEKKAPELESLLSEYWRGPHFELLPWAVSALDRTARVVGADGIDARDPSAWAAALFKPATYAPNADPTEWELKAVVPLAEARGTTGWQQSPLRLAVVAAAGAFQGSGSTPHAIDIAKVRASLPSDENGRGAALAKVPKPRPTDAQLRAASVLGLATDLGKLFADLPGLAAEELQRRTVRATHLRQLVGEGFTTDDLLKTCNEALQACATWIPAHESDSVKRALDVLRQSKLVQELKRAETVANEPAEGIESLVSVLGNDESSPVLRGCEPSLTVLASWVKSLEGRLSSDGVQDPLDEATEAHEVAVQELATLLGLSPTEGEHA